MKVVPVAAPPRYLLSGSDYPVGNKHRHRTVYVDATLVILPVSRPVTRHGHDHHFILRQNTDTIQSLGTDCAKELALFEEKYPNFSRTKDIFKCLRDRDFSRLESHGCTYLDYTGAALAPASLLDKHYNFLRMNILGNPHSENQPSALATQEDIAARQAVLSFCNADPSIYTVVWTANTSAAIKLVGESFPFGRNGAFIYAPDSHNSVLGISEFARSKGASVKGFKFRKKWSSSYDYEDLEQELSSLGNSSNGLCMPFRSTKSGKLLVFPAQSNVSGVKHCTERILDAAHQRGWDVMIDTAALAPTSGVDLSRIQPEFLGLSFYKIFGYPTGIGCLVAKKSALARCVKPWFAGGTIRVVTALPDVLLRIDHDQASSASWEDGTINFQQTSAVKMGLEWLESIGIENIRNHTSSLAAWVESSLRSMRWSNGQHFCFIPEVSEDDDRGSSVSLLVLTPSGRAVPHRILESKATLANFAIRTGVFCNPGSGTLFSQWHRATSLRDFQAHAAEYRAMGLMRISVGIPTTFEDCYRFITFLKAEILFRPLEFEDEVQQAIAKYPIADLQEPKLKSYAAQLKSLDIPPPMGCTEYELDK